jgi:hypothetical protein
MLHEHEHMNEHEHLNEHKNEIEMDMDQAWTRIWTRTWTRIPGLDMASEFCEIMECHDIVITNFCIIMTPQNYAK